MANNKRIDKDSETIPVDHVEGGPERGPRGQEPGQTDRVDERKQGAPREAEKGNQQPGGGRHSESERPTSPNSRWGSGKDQD